MLIFGATVLWGGLVFFIWHYMRADQRERRQTTARDETPG